MNGELIMRVRKYIMQLFLAIFVIFIINGCLPFQKELQVKLNQHNITKKVYIKNYSNGYDGYEKNKKILQPLIRGDEYDIIDIKENYLLLSKSKSNKLKSDVWVSLDDIETQPTYFITLVVNVPNSKIILDGKDYESNKRLPKGNYKVDISANGFLDKSLIIELDEDKIEKITLDFDIEAEKKRISEEKMLKEKMLKKIKKSIYIDKKQKLIWQDDNNVIIIKKPWITKVNYESRNYSNTKGDTATDYCKNLILANFKDWRLPSKDELKNLSTQENNLKNVSSNWYWSNTSNANNSERAWSIYSDNGDGYSDFKYIENYVRCVRVGGL